MKMTQDYKAIAERFMAAITFAKTQNLDTVFLATVLEKIDNGKKFEVALQESLNEWDL